MRSWWQGRSVLAAAVVGVLVASCGTAADPQVLDPPAQESPTGVAADPDVTPAPTPDPSTPPASPVPQPPGDAADVRVVDTVVTGLSAPWGLAFLPDGSALVTERDTARVLRVDGATATEVGRVPGVVTGGEGGLLGVAVADDTTVYLYATRAGGNEVLRATLSQDGDGSAALGEVEVLLSGIPSARIHNGGRLAFGPDGMLYVTTGDAADPSLAQDPGSLAGKILRLTPDGGVPDDNPDPASPVYSSGHRNVQGIAWDDDATLWASEFGNNTWDELNRIEAGANYGWPQVEGPGGVDLGFVDPAVVWPTDQASPSGVAVAERTVFMTALRGQQLWAVPVGDGRAGEPVARLPGDFGRLRSVESAPDGSLWLATNNTDGRGAPREGDDRIVVLEAVAQPAQ